MGGVGVGDGVAGLEVASDCGEFSDCGLGDAGTVSGVGVDNTSGVGEGDEIGIAE